MRFKLFSGFFLLILIVLSLDFSYASSSTSTNFFVPGCSFTIGTTPYNLARETCSRDGAYFCDLDSNYHSTTSSLDAFNGCKGKDGEVGTIDDCCPASAPVCTTSGCTQKTANCGDYKTKIDCEKNRCTWNGTCTAISLVSCSSYKTNETCIADPYNLGKQGVGTANCGKIFGGKIILKESCKCSWSVTKKVCSLNYTAQDWIYSNSPSLFSCDKTFTDGDCVDGSQKVNWTSMVIGTATQAEINDSGCTNGTQTVVCGQQAVKVPFFTFYNFILTALVLFIFYLFRKD